MLSLLARSMCTSLRIMHCIPTRSFNTHSLCISKGSQGKSQEANDSQAHLRKVRQVEDVKLIDIPLAADRRLLHNNRLL